MRNSNLYIVGIFATAFLASCATSAGGMRSGAAVTTMRSKGAASGQPAQPSPMRACTV